MIAAVSIVLACAKENIQNGATPDNKQTGVSVDGDKISFVVDVESTSDVKATISSSDNFTWEESDRAAVYTSDGLNKVELTPTEIVGGKAIFTGSVPSGKTIAEGAIVVYPARFLSAYNKVTFPTTYTEETETKGQGTVLAAKVTSEKTLRFKYLAATIKATITDVPSIATAITVESTQVLTGDHIINFDGVTPSLTPSSEAKTVTFSSPAKGNNTLVIPVPKTGIAQTFTYSVKHSSDVLFTQETKKTLSRNTYISMRPLTINPTVYLKSSMTDWSTDLNTKASWAAMRQEGLVYSISLNALGDATYDNLKECYKVYVEYPTGVLVQMGPGTNDSVDTENDYSVSSTNANRIPTYGTYSFSYNNTTGKMSTNMISTRFPLYVTTSSWASGSRVFNSDHELTWLNDHWAFKILETNGDFKLYYNDYGSSEHGGSGNYIKSSESKLGTMGDHKCYLLLVNAYTKYYFLTYLGETGSESRAVKIKGPFASWDGVAMTNIAHKAFGYHFTSSQTDGCYFRFNVGGYEWGANSDEAFNNQTIFNTTGVSWGGSGHDDNYWLPSSANGKELFFILHTDPGRRVYLTLD